MPVAKPYQTLYPAWFWEFRWLFICADAYDAGKLDEVFGTGTAAVVSPVGHLRWGDKVMEIGNNKIGALTQRLYDTLTGMQYGKLPDDMGWIEKL